MYMDLVACSCSQWLARQTLLLFAIVVCLVSLCPEARCVVYSALFTELNEDWYQRSHNSPLAKNNASLINQRNGRAWNSLQPGVPPRNSNSNEMINGKTRNTL